MALFPSQKVTPPKRSNHDLSHKVRTTLAPGTLVPLDCKYLQPGDKVSYSIEQLIKTQPILTPLMGSFKCQVDFFFCPLSIYNQKLHHNSLLTDFSTVPDAGFPTIRLRNPYQTGMDPSKIRLNSSSLLVHLGFPPSFADGSAATPAGDQFGTKAYNAIPVLAYYDICRNYYANQQEGILRFVSGAPGDAVYIDGVKLEDLDRLYASALQGDQTTFNFGGRFFHEMYSRTPQTPLSGLCLRSYLPDIRNVILNNTLASTVGNAASVQIQDNSFTVDQFNLASKLYKLYTLSQLAGNRFSDWCRAQFATETPLRTDIPSFLGSTSTEVVFEDVVSTAAATDEPLGTLAGRGKGYGRGKLHHFTASEPGYFIPIVSLVPRVDYYQALDRIFLDTQLSDLFVNKLNGLGLQDALQSDFYAITGSPWTSSNPDPTSISVGKQPAWINYMTDVNKVRGLFAEPELRGWTLARDMSKSISSVVQPDLFNYAFADVDISAQNFFYQCAITFYKQSFVSKRMMPTI